MSSSAKIRKNFNNKTAVVGSSSLLHLLLSNKSRVFYPAFFVTFVKEQTKFERGFLTSIILVLTLDLIKGVIISR